MAWQTTLSRRSLSSSLIRLKAETEDATRTEIDALLVAFAPTVTHPDEEKLLDVYNGAEGRYPLAQDDILKLGLDTNTTNEEVVTRIRTKLLPAFTVTQVAADELFN